MGRDRLAVVPHEIISKDDLVVEPVGARLPTDDRLGVGKWLEKPVVREQAEAREPEDVELRSGTDQDRVGAAEVTGNVTVEPGLEVGLAVVGEPTKRREDLGVGGGGIVRERQSLRDRAGHGLLRLLLSQQGQRVLDRPVDPFRIAVEVGQRWWRKGRLLGDGRRRGRGGLVAR